MFGASPTTWRFISTGELSDTDIAKAAVDALNWDITVPSDRIKVKVDKGWVTLTGEVNWDFQRRAAERAVRNLTGVSGLTNLITVMPGVKPQNVKSDDRGDLQAGSRARRQQH